MMGAGYHGVPLAVKDDPVDVPEFVRSTARWHIENGGPICSGYDFGLACLLAGWCSWPDGERAWNEELDRDGGTGLSRPAVSSSTVSSDRDGSPSSVVGPATDGGRDG